MPGLPTRQDEEFRPFIRRLPEFKCWCAVIKSTLFAFFTTFFEFFDIPVFWPILLLYFIVLFCLTMKRQIKVIFFCLLQFYFFCTFDKFHKLYLLYAEKYDTKIAVLIWVVSFLFAAYDKISIYTVYIRKTKIPE